MSRKNLVFVLGLLLLSFVVVACQPQTETVEVTRIVTETVVEEGEEVEVTRIVSEEVEVTRVVEVEVPVEAEAHAALVRAIELGATLRNLHLPEDQQHASHQDERERAPGTEAQPGRIGHAAEPAEPAQLPTRRCRSRCHVYTDLRTSIIAAPWYAREDSNPQPAG